jgi:hypothetical protein
MIKNVVLHNLSNDAYNSSVKTKLLHKTHLLSCDSFINESNFNNFFTTFEVKNLEI